MINRIIYIVFIAALFTIFVVADYSRSDNFQWRENIIQTIFVGGGITLLNRLWEKKWMWQEEK